MTTLVSSNFQSQNKARRKISRAFKMRGLSIQASALDAILNVLRRELPESFDSMLHNILDNVKDRLSTLNSSHPQSQLIVTKTLLSDVVSEMSRDVRDVTEEALQLLDAMDTPRLHYNSLKKQFRLMSKDMEKEGRSMLGGPSHKVDMMLQRYTLVQQRILRQGLFRQSNETTTSFSSNDGKVSSHKITPVESLLGCNEKRMLLGMIVQVEEGQYYLEDHTAQVPLDLSHAEIHTNGFITETCIVLVEGEMVDGTLHVNGIGHPPPESRLDAIDTIGLQNSDMFHAIPTLSELYKLRMLENKLGEEGMFVIISDLHLDKPQTLSKLESLFEGFHEMMPLPVFVFMGNFTSKPVSASKDGHQTIMQYYDDLANVISQFPNIAKNGRIIFIPGPNDPGMGGIMPRPPIPNYFTGSLKAKVRHAFFASNPCRIRYFSKELVFCRHDIVNNFRRNCIIAPVDVGGDCSDSSPLSGKNQLVKHAVKTMLDQCHLCPLSLATCPIFWQYDHALRLYPLPDAVIVGDRVDQYYENYAECDVINPGSFTGDFSFVVYRPVGEVTSDDKVKSDVEFSQID